MRPSDSESLRDLADGLDEYGFRGSADLCRRAAAEIERLRAAVRKMSHRRCRDCGHVAYYLDATIPACLCEKCGSADTRLIRGET